MQLPLNATRISSFSWLPIDEWPKIDCTSFPSTFDSDFPLAESRHLGQVSNLHVSPLYVTGWKSGNLSYENCHWSIPAGKLESRFENDVYRRCYRPTSRRIRRKV